jgi:hypothetical protein
VFCGDVAKAVSKPHRQGEAGAVYELGGPEILDLKEVIERVLAYTMRKRWLVSLPFFLAKLQGAVLQLLPNPPLTLDQVRLLERDNVVSDAAKRDGRTLEASASPSRSRSRRWSQIISNSTAQGPILRLPTLRRRSIAGPAPLARSPLGRGRSFLPARAIDVRHSRTRARAEAAQRHAVKNEGQEADPPKQVHQEGNC